MSWRSSVPMSPRVRPPEEIRRDMREIFERAEFARSKSIIERIIDWIGKQLDRLLPDNAPGVPGSGWGGPIASIIGWVVVTLLVVGLLVVLVAIIRRWRPTRRRTKKQVEVTHEEYVTAGEWSSAALAFEQAGEWKEAIRCRYRELVAGLVEAAAVDPMAGRTTGELRSDVARTLPGVSAEFHEATLLFELPWYADRPTGEHENMQFRSLAATVMSAAARPADPAESESVEDAPLVEAR